MLDCNCNCNCSESPFETLDPALFARSVDAGKWTLGWSVADGSDSSAPIDCALHVIALGQQVVVVTTGMDSNHTYVYRIWIYVLSMGLWVFVSTLKENLIIQYIRYMVGRVVRFTIMLRKSRGMCM